MRSGETLKVYSHTRLHTHSILGNLTYLGDAILKPLISSICSCGQSYGGVMYSKLRRVTVCMRSSIVII